MHSVGTDMKRRLACLIFITKTCNYLTSLHDFPFLHFCWQGIDRYISTLLNTSLSLSLSFLFIASIDSQSYILEIISIQAAAPQQENQSQYYVLTPAFRLPTSVNHQYHNRLAAYMQISEHNITTTIVLCHKCVCCCMTIQVATVETSKFDLVWSIWSTVSSTNVFGKLLQL